MEHAVHAVPVCGEGYGGRGQVIGFGHVDLENLGLGRELARRAPGKGQTAPGTH
jgi:hypothetical protein